MKKATSTILAALIVAVMMAMSAGSAFAGWAWEDTLSSPSTTVVTPGSGKADKGSVTKSKSGSQSPVNSGKGRR